MTTLNNTNNKSIKGGSTMATLTNNKSINGGIAMDTLINAWMEHLMEVGFDRLDAYTMAYRKVVRKGIKTLPQDRDRREYACMVGDGNHMIQPHFHDEGDTHH